VTNSGLTLGYGKECTTAPPRIFSLGKFLDGNCRPEIQYLGSKFLIGAKLFCEQLFFFHLKFAAVKYSVEKLQLSAPLTCDHFLCLCVCFFMF